MLEMPVWLEKQFNSLTCPQCNTQMQRDSVSGIGIRESKNDKKTHVIFIEYTCSHICGYKAIIEFKPMTLDEFVYEMLDEVTKPAQKEIEIEQKAKLSETSKPKKPISSSRKSKSRITDNEVKEAKEIIKSATTWTDMMASFGMTIEEVKAIELEGVKKDINCRVPKKNGD